ncbi:hypothetical protein NPIL_653191 [Nephila pilipes]|uniref:Uncharacterized protein n=1 Tax=Nephila pilipes TaxID=299642 RepID=A0A8X6NJY6_NEPPI|nr:hypothetical protein NPIL_653191 [Nephila pilipes]
MPQRLQCKRVWKGKVEKNHYTFSYPLGKVKDVKKFGKIFNQSALSLSPLGIQSRESNSKKVFPSRKRTNRKSTPSLAPLGIRSRLKKAFLPEVLGLESRQEKSFLFGSQRTTAKGAQRWLVFIPSYFRFVL